MHVTICSAVLIQSPSLPLCTPRAMFRGTTYKSSEKIWQGPNWNPTFNSTVSLGQILLTSLAQFPSRVAQICHDDGSGMKSGEIFENAVRAALNFRDLGLKEGDIIGIAAKNSKLLSSLVVGAFTLGTPINTLDPLFLKDDIAHMFRITRPKIVLCDLENYQEVSSALQEIRLPVQVYIFSDAKLPKGAKSVGELLVAHSEERSFVPPPIGDARVLPAAVICSSGTTGPSKGVTLSHSMVCYQMLGLSPLCRHISHNISVLNSGRFFCFSSLYWLSGMFTLIATIYQNLTRVVTTQPASPELLLEIIREEKVHGLLTTPMHLAQLLHLPNLQSEHLDGVKEWLCGGAHVPEENRKRMNKMLRNGEFVVGYGCSEIGGIASKSGKSSKGVGELAKGILLKVIDLDSGAHLGPGERGEICLKCRIPICGYFKNEEATKGSLIDGWFHTGDIGCVDDSGDLHVVDRKKDIMKVGNYQIDPSEIEKVIERIPDIVLVSVFAIPDPFLTDAPAALVVKTTGSKLSTRDVQEFVEKCLPSYKWLKGGVHFAEEMPTTPSGKILKRACRDLVVSKGAF